MAAVVFLAWQLSPRSALWSLRIVAPMRHDIVEGAEVQQNAIAQECKPRPPQTSLRPPSAALTIITLHVHHRHVNQRFLFKTSLHSQIKTTETYLIQTQSL